MDATVALLDFFESDPKFPKINALEYYAMVDLSKGREILEKLGPDATFRDLDAAIADGRIQQ